jgi:hypothetical protein
MYVPGGRCGDGHGSILQAEHVPVRTAARIDEAHTKFDRLVLERVSRALDAKHRRADLNIERALPPGRRLRRPDLPQIGLAIP